MNFMFSWQEQHLTRSLRSLVRYCCCHSNIKFISSRHRVISSIYFNRIDHSAASLVVSMGGGGGGWRVGVLIPVMSLSCLASKSMQEMRFSPGLTSLSVNT